MLRYRFENSQSRTVCDNAKAPAYGARKLPDDAPTGFIRKRWGKLVHTSDGPDRRYYELAAMTELRNGLRSGDIWVKGSRQFKDFQDYLLPPAVFGA